MLGSAMNCGNGSPQPFILERAEEDRGWSWGIEPTAVPLDHSKHQGETVRDAPSITNQEKPEPMQRGLRDFCNDSSGTSAGTRRGLAAVRLDTPSHASPAQAQPPPWAVGHTAG
jgi:hypothetical protein